MLSPEYNLTDSFITCNAYTCVELNAHSLITFILSLQTVTPSDSKHFLPWLLGSQCCEKVFCTARSMDSDFHKLCEEAKKTIDELEMLEFLKAHDNWYSPPVCFLQSSQGVCH